MRHPVRVVDLCVHHMHDLQRALSVWAKGHQIMLSVLANGCLPIDERLPQDFEVCWGQVQTRVPLLRFYSVFTSFFPFKLDLFKLTFTFVLFEYCNNFGLDEMRMILLVSPVLHPHGPERHC